MINKNIGWFIQNFSAGLIVCFLITLVMFSMGFYIYLKVAVISAISLSALYSLMTMWEEK